MSLTLQFLGAAGTVTGSKSLLQLGKEKILIDCGLFQGLKEIRQRNWEKLPVHPTELKGVVLTHAHIDHTGYLPLLVKHGFRGRIYSTQATASLCEIMLPDSGHLQEEDALYANKKQYSKHSPALPLYTEKDARESLRFFKRVKLHKKEKVSTHFNCLFRQSGHILGSAIAEIYVKGKKIVFTGDLGRQNDPIFYPPEKSVNADYIIVESTYGNRIHPDENPREKIKSIVNETTANQGKILIPTFAVGRAQQILYILWQLKNNREIPDIPIYMDSPMASEATKLFCSFSKLHKISDPICHSMFRMTQFIHTPRESRKTQERKESCIVLSASGMATGGRVLHHLKKLAPGRENCILFAGYQAKGTRGERLTSGEKEIKIHGEFVPVNARIKRIDNLSAHADMDEIMQWLYTFKKNPEKIFINHGELESSIALKERIEKELGWSATIPTYLESFHLS